MKKLTLLLIVHLSSLIAIKAQTCPAVSSVFEPNSTVTTGKLQPYALATDDYGNTFIAGDFLGNTVSFNNGVPPLQKVNGEFFIAKYDKFGNTLWAVNFGNTSTNPFLTGIAVTPDGSQIYVTGNFQGTAAFGTHSLTSSLYGNSTSLRSYDVFVAKLIDNGGTRTWAWAVGGGGKGDDYSRGIAIDNFGKVYIGGHLDATIAADQNIVFGSLPIISCLYGDDSFVARLSDNSTSASWDWLKKASANVACGTIITYDDDLFGITCNKATGDVFVTGYYYQDGGASAHTFSFGGFSIPNTNANDDEAYVLKLNTNGIGQWITKAGGTTISDQKGRGIAIDSVGNVYVIGDLRGTNATNFGLTANEIPSIASAGVEDVFIGKINANGTWAWAKGMGGNKSDYAGGIDYQNGQVWGIGVFASTASFKTPNQLTALGTTVSPANYPEDIFLVNLDKNGNWLGDGVTQMGGNDWDRMYYSGYGRSMGFDVDKNNVPHAAGRYTGTAAVFGSTTLTRAGENPFVMRANCGETPPVCTQTMSAYMPARVTPTENTNGNLSIVSILKDASNNTYLAGGILGSVTFEMAAGGIQTYTTANGRGLIVALNADKKALWVYQLGNGNFFLQDIAFSSDGIAFVGYMSGTANFTEFTYATGTGTSTQTMNTTNGSFDIVYGEIANRSGVTALNFVYNVLGDNAELGLAIAFNTATNHFAITGQVPQSSTPINFRSLSMPSSAGTTLFVAIYEKRTVSFFGNTYIQATCKSLGYPTQAAGFSTVGISKGVDVVIDGSNSAYVFGRYIYDNFTQPSFGIAFGSTTLLPSNGADMLVAKLDINGNWLWATKAGNEQNLGAAHQNEPYSISFGESGFLYLAGFIDTADPVKFGNSNISEITPLGQSQGSDAFVGKISTAGQWIWANQTTGAGHQLAGGILFKNNRIHVTGIMEGTANFGGFNLSSSGGFDFFFAELSPLGQWLPEFTQRGGGVNNETFSSNYSMPMAVDANNNVFTAGSFVENTTFGSSNLSNTIAPTANTAMIVNSFCTSCSTTDITLINPTHNVSSGLVEHKTSQKVFATNFLTGGNTLMKAGKSVELNPGFKAESGVIFKAEIGGCN